MGKIKDIRIPWLKEGQKNRHAFVEFYLKDDAMALDK